MNISLYMSCVCEVYILLTEQASSLLLPADFSADLGNQPERHIKIIQTSWEQCNKIIQKTLSYLHTSSVSSPLSLSVFLGHKININRVHLMVVAANNELKL